MKSQIADPKYRTLCIRIVPLVGAVIRLVQYPRNLVMSNSAVYLTDSGYEFTGYSATPSFSPSVIDLTGFVGTAGVNQDAVSSGVYDNARWYLFATGWNAPVEDYEPIAAGFLGKTRLEDDRYTIEMMGLVDVLNQAVGKTYSAACQKRFGGQEWAGCKKIPTTAAGTLTSVISRYSVTDSSRAEASGFFTEGTIKFTSGANAGLAAKEIRVHAGGGAITVHEPFYYLPEIGDAYTITEGCLHTQAACISKGNILNYGGDPAIPTTSVYTNRGQRQ